MTDPKHIKEEDNIIETLLDLWHEEEEWENIEDIPDEEE